MRAVGIDTSAKTGSVALVEDGSLVAETTVEMERKHSERLMPALDRSLKLAEWEGASVDLVCVSVGPGPFTGIRIGVSCAKTLAVAWGVPVVGVPTLDAIGYAFRYVERDVIVLFDARKNQVFTGHYRDGKRLGDIRCCDIEDALENVESPTLFVGNGAYAYRPQIVTRLGELASFADAQATICRASEVVAVGLREFARAPSAPEDAHALAPLYIRRPEAVVKLDGA